MLIFEKDHLLPLSQDTILISSLWSIISLTYVFIMTLIEGFLKIHFFKSKYKIYCA